MANYLQLDPATLALIQQLNADISEIKILLQKPPEPQSVLSDWVPEEVAMRLLQKGKTSLYYLRKSMQLISTDSRPVFYSFKSIENYLNNLKNN
ncbi:MAG: hypothetical protein M3Q58_14600 [Bacteroidota bacterium]|nr:hypothetical protein [Bacteroidota bacterium]